MRQTPCPGCGIRYSHGGLALHLVQTTNPLCRAMHRRDESYLPSAGSSLDPEHPERSESESESESLLGPQTLPPQASFQGDIFGDNYEDGDFPGPWSDSDDGPPPPLLPNSPDEPDVGSDDAGVESDAEWEPPSNAPPRESSDDEMGDEHGRLLSLEERQTAHDTLWVKPVIEKFPGPRAGEVVSVSTLPGYESYDEELATGTTARNPYHPFKSKIDWDFAKWAKLRGPGSTATTELLNIEGVSAVSTHYSKFNYLTYFLDA